MNWGFRRKNKYGAVRPDKLATGGLSFDSTGEFKRWAELRLLEKAGEIKDLRRQVRYKLAVDDVHICDYIADYVYSENMIGGWWSVVEDYKSAATMTPIFDIKRRLMKACHGIEVRVTGKGVK